MTKTAHDAGMPEVPAPAIEALNTMLEDAGAQGRAFYEGSMKTWSEESQRYFEGLTRDGAAALEQLRACRSPLEVMAVEQAWLAARSGAYLEAAGRLFAANLAVAERVAAPPD